MGADDEITPVGRASEEHAAAVRPLSPDEPMDMPDLPTALPADPEAVRRQWSENILPGKDWWEALDWQAALRLTNETFVQIPDRFRGALSNVCGKSLEVLKAARARGDAESEWKAFLFMYSMLLSKSAMTCGESLEERLPMWWGAQWDALWTASVACKPPPPVQTGKEADKQRAKRVHTLA